MEIGNAAHVNDMNSKDSKIWPAVLRKPIIFTQTQEYRSPIHYAYFDTFVSKIGFKVH